MCCRAPLQDIARFERLDHASMSDSDLGVAALNIFMTYIREGATNEVRAYACASLAAPGHLVDEFF